MATIFTKSQYLNVCLSSVKPKWSDFLSNIPFIFDVNDTSTEVKSGLLKNETDARAITRSTAHSDGWSRAVLAHQLPLVELMVNTVQTSIGTTTGVALQGRGIKATPYTRTVGSNTRMNFVLENTMTLSNADGSMTVTETAPNTGDYVLSCPTAWAHKMKLLVGGTADYIGNKLMNTLYVTGDTIGVQYIDSTSINFSDSASGLTGAVILDGATLSIGASGLSLTSPTTYLRTTGNFSIAGIFTFSAALPVCAVVPAAGSDLTNKTYVDTSVATKVGMTGNETVAGIKSFSSFPLTPASAPTTSYMVANKLYVDDSITAALIASTPPIDTGWLVFTQAQILLLRTTKQLLIAGPTATQYILIEKIMGYNDYDTAPFANGADLLEIQYASGTIAGYFPNSFTEAVADTIQTAVLDTAQVVNEAVYLRTTAADPTGGNAASRIAVRIIYRVITLP